MTDGGDSHPQDAEYYYLVSKDDIQGFRFRLSRRRQDECCSEACRDLLQMDDDALRDWLMKFHFPHASADRVRLDSACPRCKMTYRQHTVNQIRECIGVIRPE